MVDIVFHHRNCAVRSCGYYCWRDNQHQINLLALLARRILCIPSTSAPSQRVFSTAGHTNTKLRKSLNSANAADLIFLHGSWPVLEVSEAEKDKKRERLISSDRTKIDLIIKISIK